MAASANIVIQQGDSNLTPGSRADLVLGVPVTLLNSNNSGAVSWLWQIIDKPTSSSVALSSSIVASPTFTPDVDGTYLIKLIINSGIATDQKGAAVKTANLHYRIPAASEEGEFDGTRGWATAINDALDTLDDGYGNLMVGGSGSVTQVNTNSTLSGGPITTTGTLGINLGHSNTWTASQIINASLGIGTSPTYKLDVSGGGIQSSYGYTSVNIADHVSESGIQIQNTGSGGSSFTILVTSTASTLGAGKFVIGDGNAAAARLVIDSTGKFGFNGITSPTQTIDAIGNIKASGHLLFDGYALNLAGGAINGQALVYNGTSFIAQSIGGGSTTLQQAYTASAGATPSISLSSSFAGITIYDSSAPGNPMFKTFSSDGSIPYVTMDNTGLNVNGQVIAANYVLSYQGLDTTNLTELQIGAVNSYGGSIGRSGYGTMEWTNVHSAMFSPTQNHSVVTNNSGVFIDGYSLKPTGALTGQALVYDGSNFIPQNAIGGGIFAQQIAFGDTTTNTITGSNSLFYDGYSLHVNGNIKLPSSSALYLNGNDANWKIGINVGYTKTLITGNSIDIKVGNGASPVDGFSVGSVGGTSLFELRGDGQAAYFAGNVGIGYAPSYALDVNGTVHGAGDIIAASSLQITSGYLLLGDAGSAAISSTNTSRIRFSAADGYTSLSDNAGAYSRIQTFSNNPVREINNVSDLQLVVTSAVDVVNIPTPIAGNYMVSVYFRNTTTANLTVELLWNDVGGSTNVTMITGSQTGGSHTTVPLFINVSAAGSLRLTATAGTANVVFISANILKV